MSTPPSASVAPSTETDGLQKPLHPDRVLVVDDDRAVGTAIGRVLSGYQVTFAQSAAGAVARIRAGGRFNAIVCDFFMPGMNGSEFYDALVQFSPELARRVVFVTGHVSSPEATAFFDRTHAPCIAKPFTRDGLRSAVAAAVKLGG